MQGARRAGGLHDTHETKHWTVPLPAIYCCTAAVLMVYSSQYSSSSSTAILRCVTLRCVRTTGVIMYKLLQKSIQLQFEVVWGGWVHAQKSGLSLLMAASLRLATHVSISVPTVHTGSSRTRASPQKQRTHRNAAGHAPCALRQGVPRA